MTKTIFKVFAFIFFILITLGASAQMKVGGDTTTGDLNSPKEYVIGNVTVTGADHMDKNVLILISGLTVGDKIQVPGQKTMEAIKNIWKQGLFEDVQVFATKIEGDKIYLNISVVERPRLSKFTFRGVSKGEATDLREEIKLVRGKVVTDYLLADVKQTILNHLKSKGFLNASVIISERSDSSFSNR
jgi:outer membrane protein insertion porin family